MSRLMLAALLMVAVPSADAVSISGFRFDERNVDPRRGEWVVVKFALSEPAEVELRVWDGRDLLVRSVRSDGVLSAGEQSLRWDGRDARRRFVPAEAYRLTLHARSADGIEVTHDLTDATEGNPVVAHDLRWDVAAGEIVYRLLKPARVNIRVGLADNGPLLRTIVDWVPRPAGEQRQPWNGFDASGLIALGDHPKLKIAIDAFSLSDNTVLLGSSEDQVSVIQDLPAATPRRPTQRGSKRMHDHSQQSLEKRGDVQVLLMLPSPGKRTEAGLPIVSGTTPIRLDVGGRDRQRIIDQRLEPVFFVDGTFVSENEVGFLPTTWLWDSSTVPAGEHYLTANVRGYEGNFGMATIKVWVEHDSKMLEPR